MKLKRISNKIKKQIGIFIVIISFILLVLFSSWFFSHLWIFVIIFAVLSYFLGEDVVEIVKFAGIFGLIIFLFYLAGIWQRGGILGGFIINNEFMIVILTTIYVFFTYINLRTTREHSEISRLPNIKLSILKDLDICLENVSNKLANNL